MIAAALRWFFSDHHRPWKVLGTWAAVVALATWFGLLSCQLPPTSPLAQMLSPEGEGARVHLAFERVLPDPRDPSRYVVINALGWVPVLDPDTLIRTSERVSIEGTFHRDGRVTVERLMRHPDRGGKVWVSLAALLGLTGLTLWQGWRQRSRWSVGAPATSGSDPSAA